MPDIEKRSNLRADALSREFYLKSLLQEALEQNELNSAELENIQMQFLLLLAENVERYTNGESSSVPEEVAQAILESNFYTIGLYLKSMPSAACALAAIKTGQVRELYEQGCRIMRSKLNTARHLYRLVCETKIQTANESYNTTVEGLQSFFDLYNPQYEAHETPADIDYQLANPPADLAGVEYMIQYMDNLYLENLFCAVFDSKAINEIMLGYDKNYKDLLINLFAQTLQSALGCMLLKKDVCSLNIEPADIKKLKRMLRLPKTSIYELLCREADKLTGALRIKNAALCRYVYSTLPELSTRLYEAVVQDALHLFSPPRKAESAHILRFSMGSKMDDENYRALLSEIISCRYLEDKMQIITRHITSLADMEDLLLDGGFIESESFAVLSLLGDTEIAVLISRHSGLDPSGLSEAEEIFRLYLDKYLQQMPTEKIKKLQETAANIDIE